MKNKKQLLENLIEQSNKLEMEYGKHLFIKTDISDFDLMKMGDELFSLLDRIENLKRELGAEKNDE